MNPFRSRQNLKEVDAIVRIARRYQDQGKSYRIITPYDPQRGRLEEALKNAGLKWEDKCFNVDSFQVRSHSPGCHGLLLMA
jgi:superfamily I DNA and/or RNA helicase